jgi:hypothetical protein
LAGKEKVKGIGAEEQGNFAAEDDRCKHEEGDGETLAGQCGLLVRVWDEEGEG